MWLITFFRNTKLWLRWVFAFLLLAVGFGVGWVFRYYVHTVPVPLPIKAVRQGGYELINPLLFYDQPDSVTSAQYASLKKDMSDFINNQINTGKASKVSLYFRGMTISSSEKYSPASLMKVPTMIAILKYAQTHPEILSKKVLYDGSFDDNTIETIKPVQSLKAGNYYTIDDLLTYMIVYSDNNAAQLLLRQLDLKTFYQVFTDLGLSVPPQNLTMDNFDYIGVKSYASFFRVLYNATYLSRDMSEKAMGLLSQSDFNQGLKAGIPTDLKIAHKFGEAKVVDQNQKPLAVELHDCGFIYYSTTPYLLCIMTSGSNLPELENTVSSLSSMAYQYMGKN